MTSRQRQMRENYRQHCGVNMKKSDWKKSETEHEHGKFIMAITLLMGVIIFLSVAALWI